MAKEFNFNQYQTLDNGRIDLSKTFSSVPLPNLCDVQLKSFNWFVETGITEVFHDVFPIASNKDSRAHTVDTDQVAKLDFVKAEFGEPKHDYFE